MLTQANAGKHVYIAHSHWRGHGWRRRRWRDARVRQRLFLTHCLRRRDCGRRRRRTRYVCESVFFLLHDFVLCIFMLGARCNNKYSEFGLEFSEMFVRFSELIWVECCCFFFFLFSFYFFFCILWAHFSFSSFILPLRRFFCSAHFIFILFFLRRSFVCTLFIHIDWVERMRDCEIRFGLDCKSDAFKLTHLHKCTTDEHPLDLLAWAQHSAYRFKMFRFGMQVAARSMHFYCVEK